MVKQISKFSGRRAETAIFTRMLVERNRPERILSVFGVGGVGKSRLLEEYARISRSNRAFVCLILGQQHQAPLAIIRELGKQWRQEKQQIGNAFKDFFRSLDRLTEIERQLEGKIGKADESAGNLASEILAGGASGVIGAALGGALAGLPGAAVGGALTGALTPLLESAGRSVLNLTAQGIGLSDAQFYEDATTILAAELAKGINTLAGKGSKIVLLFDTVERLGPTLAWLRDHLLEPVCREGVSIVLAGRYKIPPAEWLDLQTRTIAVVLEPFSKSETLQYLSDNNVVNPQVQDFIYEQTAGLPLGLALWTSYAPQLTHITDGDRVQAADKEVEISETVVDNIMRNLPDPQLQAVLRVAAVPRWFNAELLAQLLGSGGADQGYAMLAATDPLTKRTQRGMSLHDALRDNIGKTMQMQSPERYHALHSTCAGYFDRLRKHLATPYDSDWQDYTLQWVYHNLMLRKTDVFETEIRAASRYYQHDFGAKLIADVYSYLEQVSSIAREVVYREACDLMYHNNFVEAINRFTSILSDPTGQSRDSFDALILYRLGQTSFWLGENEEAITRLNEAAFHLEQQNNLRILSRVFTDLARAHERLGSLPTAVMCQSKGCRYLRLLRRSDQPKEDRDYGFRLYAVGELFRLKARYHEAIVLHSSCLRVRRGLHNLFDIGESLIALAACHYAVAFYKAASDFLVEARKIYEKPQDLYMLSDILREMGKIAAAQGQSSYAQQCYQQAIDYGNKSQHRWSVRESEKWLGQLT